MWRRVICYDVRLLEELLLQSSFLQNIYNFCHLVQRHTPKDSNFHFYHCENHNLTSQTFYFQCVTSLIFTTTTTTTNTAAAAVVARTK
jgi:hypothetical protein